MNLACGDNLIPQEGLPGHQTCAIRGALPGQTSVPGTQYIDSYGFSLSHKWRNIGIMIAIAFIYLFIGMFGSEVMRFAPQGGAPLVFAKRRGQNVKTVTVNDVEKSAPALELSPNGQSGTLGELALTWKDVNVHIGEKHILKNISGYVKRGELTALCGASGAGKTTLLTALSQTNFAGQLQGEVLVGSQPPSSSYRKSVGKNIHSYFMIAWCKILTYIRLRTADGPSRWYGYGSRGHTILCFIETAKHIL